MRPKLRIVGAQGIMKRFSLSERPGKLVTPEQLAWRYGLLFLLGTAIVAGFMAYHIVTERRTALAHWHARLAFVAEAQAQLAADWLKARSADVELLAGLSGARAFLAARARGREAGWDPDTERQVATALTRAAAAYGYAGISTMDARGRVLARSNGAPALVSQEIEAIAAAARVGSPTFEIFEATAGARMLTLAVPIFSDENRADARRPLVGMISVRLDPTAGLYGILTRLSGLTRSGETVLFTPPARMQEPTIRPRDTLRIVVNGHGDLSKSYAVSADGMLDFPLIGRVKAGGLTATALAMQLQILLEKDYLVNPQVQVAFKDPKEPARFERSAGAYLSPLRHEPAGWSAVSRSLETLATAAAAAADGGAGFADATDYREMPVLAAARWVTPAGWGLAHKIDREEALADFYVAGGLTGLVATLVTLAFGILLLSLWRQRRRAASLG